MKKFLTTLAITGLALGALTAGGCEEKKPDPKPATPPVKAAEPAAKPTEPAKPADPAKPAAPAH